MKPLALMPILGRTLLDHTLGHLAREGFSQVVILSSDRPEMIRECVGNGATWGLKTEVVATSHEMSIEEAELQFAARFETRPQVVMMDRLPGDSPSQLWRTHYENFQLLLQSLASPTVAGSLTMREVSPGIWISTKARICSISDLKAPVWIGPHATVKAGARIGPSTIIEHGAFIDNEVHLENTWIGSHSYVGPGMNLNQSFAWGDGLLNWQNASFMEVQDSFMLQDISRRNGTGSRAAFWERLAALVLLLLASPLALFVALRSYFKGDAVFDERRVLLPPLGRINSFSRTYRLHQLRGTTSILQRLPELWCVIRGDMALVGNRPLSAESATALRGEVGQLWLAHPAGVFSLADAEGEDPEQMPAALAHAAFFSVQRTLRLRLSILVRCLGSLFIPRTNTPKPSHTIPAHE
jgi:lipopolysaccharide/colanic/teichoic acid biosynthesis glycosyltransferase